MTIVRAGQIKAARAILNWSQDDLAAATGLSSGTIRNLELGMISPRSSTTEVIRQAVENAGLEFIEPEGVRRIVDEIRIFQGPDSCDEFHDDLLQNIRRTDGEILAFARTPELLAASLGAEIKGKGGRLKQLGTAASMRCLIVSGGATLPDLPLLRFRAIAKQYAYPLGYFIYGSKHALVLPPDGGAFRFVVFRSASLAQSYRSHFLTLWELAVPLTAQDGERAHEVRA